MSPQLYCLKTPPFQTVLCEYCVCISWDENSRLFLIKQQWSRWDLGCPHHLMWGKVWFQAHGDLAQYQIFCQERVCQERVSQERVGRVRNNLLFGSATTTAMNDVCRVNLWLPRLTVYERTSWRKPPAAKKGTQVVVPTPLRKNRIINYSRLGVDYSRLATPSMRNFLMIITTNELFWIRKRFPQKVPEPVLE